MRNVVEQPAKDHTTHKSWSQAGESQSSGLNHFLFPLRKKRKGERQKWLKPGLQT